MSSVAVAVADDDGQPETRFSAGSLDHFRGEIAAFARERAWGRFHQPRSLLLALVGEVGELAELFQWRGDAGAAPGLPGWAPRDVEHLGEELSDVLLYLLRLADRCGVDLAAAATRKMELNRRKYPAALARGSSAKYTAYEGALADGAAQGAAEGAVDGARAGGAAAPSPGAAARDAPPVTPRAGDSPTNPCARGGDGAARALDFGGSERAARGSVSGGALALALAAALGGALDGAARPRGR